MTVESNDKIIVYSTSWCPDCHRAKYILGEYGINYIDIDVETDDAALSFVKQINGGRRVVPTIIFPDGSILVEPSNSELAAKLDLGDREDLKWY
ncbi:MAG: NrdH-redoxin [Ardenticatenaceae bacterium]|nr:NrdH-redoxin [Ardenticatenaceae bacterium]MCB9445141.1 NrdH-redoxin [Ardenticatenaceae bacterium]